MKYSLAEPVWLNEQGVRSYSEDYLFPAPGKADASDRLFMVCDGVGGSARGDQASQLTCKQFGEYVLQKAPHIDTADHNAIEGLLNEALQFTEKKLSDFVLTNPDSRGMATTLTFVWFCDGGAVLAWAGDSRIYQFREGRILYRSEDHSLVFELFKRGEITREEMKIHPRRNVITRAVSGSDQPTQIDMFVVEEPLPGDVFLLCSDGILDGISEEDIEDLISSEKPFEDIRREIFEACQAQSRDNFSMYLLKINNIERARPTLKPPIETGELPPKPTSTPGIDRGALTQLILLVTVALGALAFAVYRYFFKA